MSNARDMGIAAGLVMLWEMEKSANTAPAPGLPPRTPGQTVPIPGTIQGAGLGPYQQVMEAPNAPPPSMPTARTGSLPPVVVPPRPPPSMMQRISYGWRNMPEDTRNNIMRMLVLGGVGGGLFGLLRSWMKPREQRPGFMGTMGSMLGTGLLGAGLGAAGAGLWGRYGPAFGSSTAPKPGAAAAAAKPAAPVSKPYTPGNSIMIR